MRKWIVSLLILAAVALWLGFGVSRVLSVERDLVGKFQDIVGYYVSMDGTYVQPLMLHEDITSVHRTHLQAISKQLVKLGSVTTSDFGYATLLSVQKDIHAFFATEDLPESFTTDDLYRDWTKNATNFGQASALVRSYNEALSLYNAESQTSVGQMTRYWSRWEYPEFLNVDGTTEETTRISF